MATWTKKTVDRPPRRTPKMHSPLTAMIDVTFQLLLFFLLTFTFRQAEGQLPGSLPAEGPGPIDVDRLRITLRPTGPNRTGVAYEVEGYPRLIRTPMALGEVLEGFAAIDGGRQTQVIIQPRGDVQWRWAVEAFNQAVRARFRRVYFAQAV